MSSGTTSAGRLSRKPLQEHLVLLNKIDLQSKFVAAFSEDPDALMWIELAFGDIDGPSITPLAISHEHKPEIRQRLLAAARPVAADAS